LESHRSYDHVSDSEEIVMTDQPRLQVLEISASRRLEALVEGSEDGYPLVFFPGVPTAAAAWPLLSRLADERGLKVISYSRPGYGGSSPRRPGSIADDIEEVKAVLDWQGVEQFIALGWSGGGPRAIACAALMPDRCRGVAAVASLAPRDSVGLDFYDGMGADTRGFLEPAATDEAAHEAYLKEVGPVYAELTAEGLTSEVNPGEWPEKDVTAMRDPEFADYLTLSLRRAQEAGGEGWRCDNLALVSPWNFDLGTITVPVAVWYGELDPDVPPAHGKWLASHIPGATEHATSDDGHLSIISDNLGAILDDLTPDEVSDFGRQVPTPSS
jgi:pimeloyl-ACP methyl ester carboxylesterase